MKEALGYLADQMAQFQEHPLVTAKPAGQPAQQYQALAKEYQDAMQTWLRGNVEKYRIQRFVAGTPK